MVSAIIPVLAAMYLGSSFNMKNYQKGDADVFDNSMLDENIHVIDRSFTKSQYKLVDSSLEARKFLDVDGDLSLRIKKGDINIGGAGAYLMDTANRQNFVELLVRVQHETVTETIPSHLKPRTDWMSMPPSKVGTHFVRSLTYGGELIASLRLKASNVEEKEIIKAAVTANLQLSGTFDLNSNGSFDKLRQDLKGMYNIEIKVTATKQPTSPPQTVEDLMKLVEEYPKEIQTINNGKGKGLKAELYPLSSLKQDYPTFIENKAISNILDDVESKYDDIRLSSQELRAWTRSLASVTDEDEERIDELFGKIQTAQHAFNKAITNMDVSVQGLLTQFDEAYKAYGVGKDNVPGRFQRLFRKLRHEIANDKLVWEKPTGSGATYVAWGATDCGKKSDKNMKLNRGHAAATASNAWGGGKDFLCFPTEEPALSKKLFPPSNKISAAQTVFQRSYLNPDSDISALPCATCLAIGKIDAETFPAMKECPSGWDEEYTGYLMAESVSNVARDFLCVKEKAEKDVDIAPAKGSPKLNNVFMNCGDCGIERIVPCVVCTK